jgi:hypothetical protein
MEKIVSSDKGPGIFYLLFALKVNNLDRQFFGLGSYWLSQKQLVIAVQENPSTYCDKLNKPTYTLWNPVQNLLMVQKIEHKETL